MNSRLTFALLLVPALAACGATSGEEPQKKNPGTTPAVTSAAAPAAAPVADDQAKAEAKKAAKAKSKTTKPAIDTSDLKAAPTWALADMAGNVLKSSDLTGKVVVVDFWATWCGPCRAAIPHLMGLYKDYKEQGVEIVGVSLDQQGVMIVKPFVDKNGINYPVVLGNQKVAQDFGGVQGIPTAFVITQDGKIYKRYVGLRPRETYEKDIKVLLGLPS